MSYNNQSGTVACVGFFDGVHLGHQQLIQTVLKIAEEKNLKPAVITFDVHPKTLSSQSPLLLNHLQDRVSLISKMVPSSSVFVLPFNERLMSMPWDRFLENVMMKQFQVKHFVLGEDHTFGKNGNGNADTLSQFCQNHQLTYSLVPTCYKDLTAVSSTAIRNILAEGDFTKALSLLGHPHLFSGEVVTGQHLGHTLGFPTLNILWPSYLQCPPFGVYQSQVEVHGKRYHGMTDIGTKPTVNGSVVAAETHLFDFNEDLYHETVSLELLSYLRPEIKFQSLDALIAQLQQDRETIKTLFQQDLK